jgi:hypothetical protein
MFLFFPSDEQFRDPKGKDGSLDKLDFVVLVDLSGPDICICSCSHADAFFMLSWSFGDAF